MKTEIFINYNEAVVEIWHNALQEDCLSFTSGDTTLKILDVPKEWVKAINEAEDR